MAKTVSKPIRTDAQVKQDVDSALAWLKNHSSESVRDGMARYGLPSDHAYGVPMRVIQQLAKQLGRDQTLASALWDTGCYEARLLTAYIGEPELITSAEMDRWCRDFDNWGVVDTLCFAFFDRTPHAWSRIESWVKKENEFQRRAGFVLLACLAAHDLDAPDEALLQYLPLVERGAADERNFVKKGVSWALRMIGRRSPALNAAALIVAQRLVESVYPAARWVGKDARRQLTSLTTKRAVEKRSAAATREPGESSSKV
jgi:3-methyladenine DNA glycosylase AlkD